MRVERFFKTLTANKFLTLNSCVLSLLTATPVVAEYKPPSDQLPPTTTTLTTGTRGGCDRSLKPPLTTLAPQTHTGQTTTSHPTFAWFIPDSKPFPMEFRLYEYDKNGKIQPQPVQIVEMSSSPGIMQLALPKDKPGLTVGQTYLWQVTVLCNRDYPSTDLVARAKIKVVETPPTLKIALTRTRDRTTIANLYAESGFWYDALRETLAPNTSKIKNAASLLTNLAELEEQQEKKSRSEHSVNLSRIANINR